MLIETLSVFPGVFGSYLGASIMGRAQDKGILEFRAHDLRDWTHDRHRTVDDAPFGGGQGMLMKPAPIFEAMADIKASDPRPARVIFFTPVGTPFTQDVAERLSHEERLVFVCGRYEGMDERVYELADESLSLGDYVLTGGELPAMVVTDAVVRLLPGALGDEMSTPSTRGPQTTRAELSPRFCSRATMPRLTPGAGETPSSERLASGPISLMRPSLRSMSAPMPASFLTGA